jgi:hypothetical protein
MLQRSISRKNAALQKKIILQVNQAFGVAVT